MKLIVTEAAYADIARVHAFLAEANPRAAERAVAIIRGGVERLLFSPGVGKPSGVAGQRELIVPFGKSAYILRYAHDAEKDELVLVRVWHGREQRR